MPWLQLSAARRHNSAVLLKDEMISSIKPWCHNWRLENNEDFCRLCQCESNNLKMYERSHRTPSAFIHLLNDGFKKRREAMLGRPARDVDLPWHSWTAARSPACGTPPCSGCWLSRPSQRTSWTRRPGCRWRLPWRLWRHKNRRNRDEVKSWTAAAGGERMRRPHLSCDAVPCVPALWEDRVYIRMLHLWPGGKKTGISGKHSTCPRLFLLLLPHADTDAWRYRWLISTCTAGDGRIIKHTHTQTTHTQKNISPACGCPPKDKIALMVAQTLSLVSARREIQRQQAASVTVRPLLIKRPGVLPVSALIGWYEKHDWSALGMEYAWQFTFEGICSTEWIFTCAAGSKWHRCASHYEPLRLRFDD